MAWVGCPCVPRFQQGWHGPSVIPGHQVLELQRATSHPQQTCWAQTQAFLKGHPMRKDGPYTGAAQPSLQPEKPSWS